MSRKSIIPAEELRKLAQDLVDAESPNPPGDVSLPLEVAVRYLEAKQIPYTKLSIDPSYKLVNIVARVVGDLPGPHLVMNAHLDVFPHSDQAHAQAKRTPASAELVSGRGAVDMKGGAAVFMVIMNLLNQRRHQLHGQVSLCLVCDEETFGPYGSRSLLKMFPELAGDALLSTEPSSLSVIRVGERGFLWGTVEFTGKGGHGAYPGSADSPIEKSAAFIQALRREIPENWGDVEQNNDDKVSQSLLAPKGASFVDHRSLNFGIIKGGLKVNMQPDTCSLELDIRLPVGQKTADVIALVEKVASQFNAKFHVDNSGEPNISDKSAPIFAMMKQAVLDATQIEPSFAVGLGCTDARLWRYRGVPAAVYGPDPSSMAKNDETVTVNDLVTIATVHYQTACAFLSANVAD